MHRCRNNKGRFVSSRDLKTNPHTNSTDIGAGRIPLGGSSREASEALEEGTRTEELVLWLIERESTEETEHLEETQNPVYEPSISGGRIPIEMT